MSRLWVDDCRTPPDDTWIWVKTADLAIYNLDGNPGLITEMSLDHDLGGEGYGAAETTRPIVEWLKTQGDDEKWPQVISIHSWNPEGAAWLKEQCELYSPWQDEVSYVPSEKHWSGVEPPALNPMGMLIAQLHNLIGHEKTRLFIQGEDLPREDCVLCRYDKGLATREEVMEALTR